MYEDLVKRLRDYDRTNTDAMLDDAADAIEALNIECNAMRCAANSFKIKLEQVENKNYEYLRHGLAQADKLLWAKKS